jgi:hypothetical protein
MAYGEHVSIYVINVKLCKVNNLKMFKMYAALCSCSDYFGHYHNINRCLKSFQQSCSSNNLGLVTASD